MNGKNKVLVTGGGGFIGSHIAEKLAKNGYEVIVLDNFFLSQLLGKVSKINDYNWDYLKKVSNVQLVKGDIRNIFLMKEIMKDVAIIFHAAAQTDITISIDNPELDFTTNIIGSFNILEAARISGNKPTIIFCSTNKVYGDNVNSVPIVEHKKRYDFSSEYSEGISENFSIDNTKHTPYGCSKASSDLYMQSYSKLYDLRIGIFRMSCIYGTHQFGFDDQGLISWFTIATIFGKSINIYGDGKQVRDILFVDDLTDAYFNFLKSDIKCGVYNIGGGSKFTISLLELLDYLESVTGKRSEITFHDFRSSDQKVYISNISKVYKELNWTPKISPKEGIQKLITWIEENKNIF